MNPSKHWCPEVEAAAQTIWNYHRLNHTLEPVDIVLVLGSHDLRVGDRAAELYHKGLSSQFLFTGGFGHGTKGVFARPEAELISERAVAHGCPESCILRETQATNTGENIRFSKALLLEKNIRPQRGIAIQKPYMERRAFAALCKQWPEVEWKMTSPRLDFHEYCCDDQPMPWVTEIMVGDLQRIMEYPKLGFQVAQDIPPNVERAYQFLIQAGFDGHLMPV